jgi:hypothetical protein
MIKEMDNETVTKSYVVDQLKNLNKIWSSNSTAATTSDATGNKSPDINANDIKQNQQKTSTRTPLEKAILKLSSVASHQNYVKEFIVPFLFSVLGRNNDKVTSHSTIDDTNESELKQIQWHIVLILELWAAQTADNDGGELLFLEACATSVQQLDQSRNDHGSVRDRSRSRRRSEKRKRNENGDHVEKKKKTKNNKKNQTSKATTLTTSNKDKETILLDHLVRLMSRAPFLLPVSLSLRDFLIDCCLNRKSHWERLPHVFSHIFLVFEISNPYLPRSQDDEIGLFSSSFPDTDSASVNKKPADETPILTTAAQRKKSREKQLTLTKNKNKKRLVALTTKTKRRGSHFNGNLQGISKLLLDKKKTPLSSTTTSKNTSNRVDNTKNGSTTIQNGSNHRIDRTKNTADVATRNKKRKVNDQKSVTVQYPTDKSKPTFRNTVNETKKKVYISTDRGANESKPESGRIIQAQGTKIHIQRQHSAKTKNSATSKDLTGASIVNKRISNNISSINNNDAFKMTPKRSVRSYSDVANETVVGETPTAGAAPQLLVAGETPTYGVANGSIGSTPMSCISFISALALPSPPTISTSVNTGNTPPKPVKLFGTVKLLKRKEPIHQPILINSNNRKSTNNNIGSLGKIDEKNKGNQGNRPSSVHMARAYLQRRKTD